MAQKYRTEKWEMSYDVETAFGQAPTLGMTANRLLGVFQEASLPNPKFNYQFIWGMNPAKRSWYTVYKGKAESSGSISNIILLDGRALYLPIANVITHTGSAAPYTHTINETISLPSFRLVATNIGDNEDTAGVPPANPDYLSRWFVGGKINSASFHCEEGDMLKMDISALFKMLYYDAVPTPPQVTGWWDTDANRQTITASDFCGDPYYFSQCVITAKIPILGMASTTINTIKTFKLEVNNNLEPKYYLSTQPEKVPYEIWEGKREYTMNLVVDLVDAEDGVFTKNTPLLELLNQGGSPLTGAAFKIAFTRVDGSSITFETPADYNPSCAGDDQGCIIIGAPMNIGGTGVISVPMDIKCRSLKITVVDSYPSTAYPV